MSSEQHVAVMRRKLLPRRRAVDAAPRAIDALVRLEFPREADDLLALSVEVRAMAARQLDEAAVLGALQDSDLIFLLESQTGAHGLCVLDAGLVAGLIEVQLTGRVSASEAVPRAATRTDAIVVSDMVDRWISAAQNGAEEGGFGTLMPLTGFFRSDTCLDLRAAALTLDPGMYEMLRVVMSLDGAKEGVLSFFLPPAHGALLVKEGARQDQLREQLQYLPVEMEAILARVQVPLSKVVGFEAGDTFDVPADAVQKVRLENPRGKKIIAARLGHLDGARAVRLRLGGQEEAKAKAPRPAASLAAPVATSEVDLAPELQPVDLPAMPEAGLPELPEVPELSTVDDLPDLSDLPDLPDLPELTDLPDLQDLP